MREEEDGTFVLGAMERLLPTQACLCLKRPETQLIFMVASVRSRPDAVSLAMSYRGCRSKLSQGATTPWLLLQWVETLPSQCTKRACSQ